MESKKEKQYQNRLSRNSITTSTMEEHYFEELLVLNKIPYEKEKEILIGHSQYFIDFVIDGIGYEIDGGQHYTNTGIKKDKQKANRILKYTGIPIKHIKNSEVIRCYKKQISFKELLEFNDKPIKEAYIRKPKIKKHKSERQIELEKRMKERRKEIYKKYSKKS